MIGWTGSQLDARPKSADAAFTLTSISLPNTLKLQGLALMGLALSTEPLKGSVSVLKP